MFLIRIQLKYRNSITIILRLKMFTNTPLHAGTYARVLRRGIINNAKERERKQVINVIPLMGIRI